MIDEAIQLESTQAQPIVIASPSDMARMLLASCPEKAAAFAIAAHERACWAYDENYVLFWEQVIGILSREAGQPESKAA